MIKPAYGYRIEYGGRVAVISGDTRYNQNVIKYGTGADLLVHEVAARAARADEGSLYPAHHRRTTSMPRDAGVVFAQTKPEARGLSRTSSMLASDRIPPPTLDEMVAETRQTYDGPLAVRRGPDVFRDRRRDHRSTFSANDAKLSHVWFWKTLGIAGQRCGPVSAAGWLGGE